MYSCIEYLIYYKLNLFEYIKNIKIKIEIIIILNYNNIYILATLWTEISKFWEWLYKCVFVIL